MSSTSAKTLHRSANNKTEFSSVFGIKAAIIIVGFILLVAVLSLFYFSSWSIVTKQKYAILASAYIYATSTYILLLCTLVTSLAIIVLFVAAWVEHRKGLRITLLILIVTFILEIASGLLAFGYTMNLEQRLSRNLLITIEEQYHVHREKTNIFDQMQKRFRCCGSRSFKDWQLNSNFNSSMASAVPDSCCKSYEPRCAQKPYGKHPSNIFHQGCSSALYRFYHSHLIALGSVTLSVAFLQLIIIILLFSLTRRIQKIHLTQATRRTPPKARRLSNEITYYPLQSSSAVK